MTKNQHNPDSFLKRCVIASICLGIMIGILLGDRLHSSTKTKTIPPHLYIFSQQFFENEGLEEFELYLMESSLQNLGYDVGKIDGKITSETTLALRRFVYEYKITISHTFIKKIPRLALFHSVITGAHQDWLNILRTGELYEWILEQPIMIQYGIRKLFEEGDPEKIVEIVAIYKKNKTNGDFMEA